MIIVSFIFQSPIRWPSREPSTTWEVADMFSWPPATTSEASPHLIACAASITAFSPLPQTLSMVIAGTSCGSPAPIAACRAGFWPSPAVSTFPMITSSICAPSTPPRSSTALITVEPSAGAETFAREPPKFPTAVRAAEMITAIMLEDGRVGSAGEQITGEAESGDQEQLSSSSGGSYGVRRYRASYICFVVGATRVVAAKDAS